MTEDEIKQLEKDFFDKNFVKLPDFEGIYKLYEKFERELADKNFEKQSDFEDYRKQIEKEFFDFHMVIINFGVTNIEQHESYPPELRTIAAEQYRADAIYLLEQVIERRDWGIDFCSLLEAYKPLFEKVVLDWYKRKIVHFVNRVNDQPTDELYQLIIQDQYKAESELLINSNNPLLPLLPFYHDRLTSLMANLDKRYKIVGSFDNKRENESEPDNKPKTAAWAYYYFIIHQIDPAKRFDCDPEGIEKAIQRIADEKGLSWKSFQQQYINLNNSKPTNNIATTAGKIPTIKKVIELLKDNPEALVFAKECLRKAIENKDRNKK